MVSTEHAPARGRAFRVYLQHAIIGFLFVVAYTIARAHNTASIIAALGHGGPILIALFFVFTIVLAQLLFPLTEQTSVSLVITASIVGSAAGFGASGGFLFQPASARLGIPAGRGRP